MERKFKNILIKNNYDTIEIFKKKGFEFYKDNNKMHLFSYKHYLIVILLNLESYYKEKYKTIHTPSQEYVLFYKRRGTNIHGIKETVSKSNISFSLPNKYYELYYELMHTYYLANQDKYSNYSSSLFFSEIVDFILSNPINFIEFSE